MNSVPEQLLTRAFDSIDELLDWIEGQGWKLFRTISDDLKLSLKVGFRKYQESLVAKLSSTKTFFIRNEPAPFYDVYVSLDIVKYKLSKNNSRREEVIEDANFNKVFSAARLCVVTGSAGSGKTMFVKHLMLDALANSRMLPVLVELRSLNTNKFTIIQEMLELLNFHQFKESYPLTEKLLASGKILLILDGYDEVSYELRGKVRTEMESLSDRYSKLKILCTSRPDSELNNLSNYHIFEMMPLSIGKANSLIVKLPFEEELKESFLKELNASLFESHSSFLSNPLLLSIMLLTYGRSANIPTKYSVFYSQAYEALYQRHDALKGGYTRDRKTKLDMHDFAKILNYFCLQSYDTRQIEFGKTFALSCIESSSKLANLQVKAEDYLADLLQATSLLVDDGLILSFAHRSFQEYFVAKCVLDADLQMQAPLINKYKIYVDSDKVFDLLFEMKQNIIERYYIVPEILRIMKTAEVKRKIGITHYIKLLKIFFKDLSYRGDGRFVASFTVLGEDYFNLFRFVLKQYLNGAMSNFIFDAKAIQKIFEESGVAQDEQIDLSKLTSTHPFVIATKEYGGELSFKAIESLQVVLSDVQQRLDSNIASLESILNKR